MSVQLLDLAPSILSSRSQAQQSVELECTKIYQEPPTIKISYLAGALQETVLKLPITLAKFMTPAKDFDMALFTDRWHQLSAAHLQAIRIIENPSIDNTNIRARLSKILLGHRWAILQDLVDKNILCGAAVLSVRDSKDTGCLVMIQPKPDWNTLEIVIRSSVIDVSDILQADLAINLPSTLATIP